MVNWRAAGGVQIDTLTGNFAAAARVRDAQDWQLTPVWELLVDVSSAQAYARYSGWGRQGFRRVRSDRSSGPFANRTPAALGN